jgi:RND superfamily putative drug exporter
MTPPRERPGPVGRLGGWSARHRRIVFAAAALLAIVCGSQLTTLQGTLSGAGWEQIAGDAVAVRTEVQQDFPQVPSAYAILGVVGAPPGDVAERDRVVRRVTKTLAADPAISAVQPPRAGTSISADGSTAIVTGLARGGSATMVDAAKRLAAPLRDDGAGPVRVWRAGLPAQWADFNQDHKEATTSAEILSWPVTLVILAVAFGSLVAAGLPLLMTALGLAVASGMLAILGRFFELSIWSQNFVLLFTLALGIDYALFIVMRFRSALADGRSTEAAVVEALDTAGTAVVFSGAAVLCSLATVLLVPNLMMRSVALGIILSVALVVTMSVTLLPAVLGTLGHRVDRLPLRRRRPLRSTHLAAWAAVVWRHPLLCSVPAVAAMLVMAWPATHARIGAPGLKVMHADSPARVGAERVAAAFGPLALGPVQVTVPGRRATAVVAAVEREPGLDGTHAVTQAGAGGRALVVAGFRSATSLGEGERILAHLRQGLPAGAHVGGPVAEAVEFKNSVADVTPLVLVLILSLSTLVLMVAFRAPLIAVMGAGASVLATSAAFGVTVWMFQDGHLAGVFGFESQGFIDFYLPVLFFAMVFAISMDYTVFLVSATKEEWDRTGEARSATIEGVARSGPVIIAAAAVMVGVFASFAVADSLASKEFGLVLALAVLLDAGLVRLLVLPACLRLLGPAAWWSPSWPWARRQPIPGRS